MISVLIPARCEKFLQKTIDSLLSAAEGEIEIIAVLEEYWPDPPIRDEPRVILIHHSVKRGMRTSINEAARIAKGKYIMKCDAHCLFDKGFDVKLAADCEYNWLAVPTRYSLDDETWTRRMEMRKKVNYMYITSPSDSTNEPFRGQIWRDYEKERKRENVMIDDLMTFQGSCWFMHKEFFFFIGGLENSFSTFVQEAQELGNKTWLSGGRVICNKNTWYAHLHKGKKHGRGYFLSKKEMSAGHDYSMNFWLNNKWPGQKREFKWLIDHFAPVPGWENYNWSMNEDKQPSSI